MFLLDAVIGAVSPAEWSLGSPQHIENTALSQYACMGWREWEQD